MSTKAQKLPLYQEPFGILAEVLKEISIAAGHAANPTSPSALVGLGDAAYRAGDRAYDMLLVKGKLSTAPEDVKCAAASAAATAYAIGNYLYSLNLRGRK